MNKFSQKSVIIPLIIINIVIFVLQFLIPGFTEMFLLNGTKAFFEPWRFFTSMFLHGGLTHIFFNMYALLLFGPLTEQRLGNKRFLFIYLFSGFLSALIGAFFYDAALGASGAIMGVIGVLIILNPDLKLLMFFVIPMSLRTAGIFWIILDFIGVFHSNGVANIAHLVGIVTGLIFGRIMLKKSKSHKVRFVKSKTVLDDDDIDDYLKYGKL